MLRVLLTAVLALSLAGCGEQKKSDAPASPDTSIFDKKEVPKTPTGKQPNQKAN